ncbi:MAG: hypothetical protein GF353_00080 [Candidatus Lokiarchaeota archaeon]|nr:hypothetical protein [Candidatus Lokiarchaeota archaeon]
MDNKKRPKYQYQEDFDAFEDIKNADTSGNKPNSLVEKILVKMVEDQKIELSNLKNEFIDLSETKNKLAIENAVLKNETQTNKILEIIRNISGIALGIFSALIFSSDELTSKFAMIGTPFFLAIFIFTYLKTYTKKNK